MARKPYQTDLTDQQWKELQPLIPSARRGGRPRRQDMREVKNRLGIIEYQYASLSTRLDRIDARVERIEHRLELTDA